MNAIEIVKSKVDHIPVIWCEPNTAQPLRPILLFLSHFTGSKEAMEPYLREAAEQGFISLSFDAFLICLLNGRFRENQPTDSSLLQLGCRGRNESIQSALTTTENRMSMKAKMLMSTNLIAFFLLIGLALASCTEKKKRWRPEQIERITQRLVPPPAVPAHDQVAKGPPKVVQIRLVIEEKQMQIAPDGATIWAMTYNGSVPGPLIVVHEDDFVELTLVNPSANTLLHNIDFHAATGALGGGDLTKVSPGQEVILRFQATKPGVFIYHCAPGGAMVPWHMVSGMNGAIMVLPRDSLKDANGRPIQYDKAYYIGEQDFYIPKDSKGKFKTYENPSAGFVDMLEVMRTLTPSHVVFNGHVDSLTGKNAMQSKVGETVLFIHSQANRDSRPHLIGGHADLVWKGGSFADAPATNLETWFVPGGSATATVYTFKQPGLYVYLNHTISLSHFCSAQLRTLM